MRAARTDANQNSIVAALRKIGASVTLLHAVGKGCPDLAVGFRNRSILVEVKDGTKPASRRALTAEQVEWHANWRGEAHVVYSVEDALRVVIGD